MSNELQLFLVVFLGALVCFEISRLANYLTISHLLARVTRPYSHYPQNPTGRLLIIGDSYGVGVGASIPEASLSGLIAKDFPTWEVQNLSKNLISTSGLVRYLMKKEEFGKYDLVVVLVGGMDIINHTPKSWLGLGLTSLISLLKQHSKGILLVIPGHAGLIPIYHFPLSAILNHRSRMVRKLFKHVAKEYNVEFTDEGFDLLLRDRNKLYAADKNHPNDAGYKLWYEHLRESIVANMNKINEQNKG